MTDDRDTVDISRGWQALKSKYSGCVILAAALLAILAAVAVWGYLHWRQPAEPVTQMSQQQAGTVAGVQLAADNAGLKLTPSQAQEIAQAVASAADPVAVVNTTGQGLKLTLGHLRDQAGANFQIVTDSARPDKPPDPMRPEQPIVLNVYNVKAYPKHLVEVTAYQRSADVAYMTLVTVFKRTGYLGPVVSYDADRSGSKARIGIRLSVPMD